MDKTNNIIERIKAVAKQQGITQTFLCKQIGKRATYLNEVKLGKDRIHDNEIEVIAFILNTTPAYLRGETDDPEPPAAEGDWVDEIKISPAKLACAKQIARLSDAHAEVMSGLFEFNEEDIRAVARALVLFKNRGE